LTPKEKIKPLRRSQIVRDVATALISLPLGLMWMAIFVVGGAGFLGDDRLLVTLFVAVAAILGVVDAVLVHVCKRAREATENAVLAQIGPKLYLLDSDEPLYVTDIRSTGDEVRVCDPDGRNQWHPISAFRFDPADAVTSERTTAELDRNILTTRKTFRSAGMKALFAFGAFIVAMMIHAATNEAVPDVAEIARWSAILSGAATAFLAVWSGLKFNDWISAMSERHVGTHWRTKDEAVGECTGVWPMPESFTLRFPNGSRGEYNKAELVTA
jgi:hypothetical protein